MRPIRPAFRATALAGFLASTLLAACPAPRPAVSRSYKCETDGGCTVTVSGRQEYYPYGVVVPVACGPGVIFVGCGCGPVVVGPACGPVVVGCGACGGACGVAVASCGGGPSCGGASCGGGCGGGCGGCS